LGGKGQKKNLGGYSPGPPWLRAWAQSQSVFTCQVASARSQRKELCCFQVKLPHVTTSQRQRQSRWVPCPYNKRTRRLSSHNIPFQCWMANRDAVNTNF